MQKTKVNGTDSWDVGLIVGHYIYLVRFEIWNQTIKVNGWILAKEKFVIFLVSSKEPI